MDADGTPVHAGDMAAQTLQAIENLEAVLSEAGMTLADVARLNWFVTDVAAFFAAASVARHSRPGCRGHRRP